MPPCVEASAVLSHGRELQLFLLLTFRRGDSPVTLMVAKRPAKKSPPSLIPDKADVSAVGLLSDAASKQTRSAFGCDACKKRKIKCDEQRVSSPA